MQKNVRYYITKADDQAVVRSVPVTRPRVEAAQARQVVTHEVDRSAKPSVGSLLRLALLRKHGSDRRG